MNRTIVLCLLINLLISSGVSFASSIDILTQSNAPNGYQYITVPETTYVNGITMPEKTDWLTFAESGYISPDSLFVKAAGNANSFGQYSRTDNPNPIYLSDFGSLIVTSMIVFRPTSAFYVDFKFYVVSWDALARATLFIDDVKTHWSYEDPRGMVYHETPTSFAMDSNHNYIIRLLLDPSKTYKIISEVDTTYKCGGTHGFGTASLTATVISIPEPLSFILLVLGVIWLLGVEINSRSNK